VPTCRSRANRRALLGGELLGLLAARGGAAVSSILVLDDRATERDLLSTVLGYAGHAVVQASTGEDALSLARPINPT
jgi:PleD family two-component response regulator